MVPTADRGNALRRQRHRAVSAATAVDAALLGSELISRGDRKDVPLTRWERPIVRYANLEALLQKHMKPDTHKVEREALLALQTVTVLRDEFAVLDDAILRSICTFLGDCSRDVVRVSSLCRRLRNIVIGLTPPVAVIVPDMIPPESLAKDAVVDSLCAFFAKYKRGQFVRQLRILDAKYASSWTVSAPLPLCSTHMFPTLAKQMLNLTFLDLRGVQWDCNSNPNLPQYFFGDLHFVAPRLQILKIGVELFTYWSVGWWQRCKSLLELVVGSRRDQAAAPATPLRTVALHEDVFEMLHAPHRPWRLKLWCALETDAVLRLLVPMQAFPELQELALNILNRDILEDLKRPLSKSSKEMKMQKTSKRVNTHNVDEIDTRVLFPSLQALTLANVDQSSTIAVDLLERVALRSPRLKYFSVVNTARIPPPPPKARRQV